MGIIRMGPPEDLISQLRQHFKLENFVETGTYRGRTSAWAANLFNSVYTIEYSEELYKQAKEAYLSLKNIYFLWGDSRSELEKLLPNLEGDTLFWLDAHWSGGETYGEEDQCPLINEILTINQYHPHSYIFIDDARLFTSPPQPPHKLEYWSDITELIGTLQQSSVNKYIVIIEDVIIAVPVVAKQIVAQYCQKVNERLWEEYGQQNGLTNFQRGLRLILKSMTAKLATIKSKICLFGKLI
jgi:hypothetical protein